MNIQKKKEGKILTETEKISAYEQFLDENKKRINEQFNVILRACILAGPLIAVAVYFHVFSGVTYVTALIVSLFMLTLTVIHKLLLKKYATSIVTSMVAMFAIDILLIVMDSAHLTIYICWFLIPLLSIQFCDFKLYFVAVAINYGCMVFATWHMAPFFTERRNDIETPFAYFASRLGGLTVEMIMMVFAGYTMCKMIRRYYKNLIDQSAELDRDRRLMERLNGELSSVAEIYMRPYDVNILDDSYFEIHTSAKSGGDFFSESKQGAKEFFEGMLVENTDSEYLEDMREFADYSTLPDRMKDSKTITREFKSASGIWCRARFVVSQRNTKGGISHVLWLVEDIDAEKRKRDALVDMSERAIAASKAKSFFLSNMSHEIRTPINAVLGMNEMILRECRDDNIAAYAESVRVAGNSLLGIVNDILDFSKIEAGKMEIIPVDYDLSSVLNDLVNMVQTRADEKGLKILIEFDKTTPKLLHGDDVRIKQVITNILTNAVKYTEKGSVTFRVAYEKLAGEEAVLLKVSVKDTGIGIKKEDMEKLFSEFERIDEERNRYVEGTGLGMNITKRLLHMMGSDLQVSSVYGEGSEFSFAVKQGVVKWEELGDYEASYRQMLKSRKAYKERFTAPQAEVLMVDDNPMNLMVFKSLLKQTQLKVDVAESGDEGLAMAYDKKYDIIFLDHMMPDKDGIETLHEMQAQKMNPNIHTPVVCLTANAISGAREEYIKEGFDDYLTKPIDSVMLEELLIAYLPPEKVVRVQRESDETEEEIAAKLPQELQVLSGQSLIDVSGGIINSGGVEAYLPLLKVFYESADRNAEEINRLYADEDYKNYTIRVHALKSSARIIGAAAFGEKAQSLEDAGKDNNRAYIRENHETFMQDYARLRELLAPIYEGDKPDDSELIPADAEMMQDVYAELREAADSMDTERLEGVFEDMKGYSVPSEDAELFVALKKAADAYDYEKVLKLLDDNRQE